MPRQKKHRVPQTAPMPANVTEIDISSTVGAAAMTGKGFSHENLCSLREVTNGNLANLRQELLDARANKAATIANLEAWRDELEETIAILRAHR